MNAIARQALLKGRNTRHVLQGINHRKTVLQGYIAVNECISREDLLLRHSYLDNLLEDLWLVDSELGEHLAIDLDILLLEAIDED